MIVALRAGLAARPMTLGEVAKCTGLSRERVRQIEKAAIRRMRIFGWGARVATQLEHATGGQSIQALDLGSRDPFFTIASSDLFVFEHFVNVVLDGELRAHWVGSDLVVTCSRRIPNTPAVERVARALDFSTRADVFALLAEKLGCDPPLARILARELEPQWIRSGERIIGFGTSRTTRIAAELAVSDTPVDLKRLFTKTGRTNLPKDVILVDEQKVMHVRRIPHFEADAEVLARSCEELMRELGPSRQWSTLELLPLLAQRSLLPGWCNRFSLGSVLERKGLRSLGRNTFALPDAKAEGRTLHQTLVDVLEKEGAPLDRDRLEARAMALRGFAPLSFGFALAEHPFVLFENACIGLVSRDLPGGETAAESVRTEVREILRIMNRPLPICEIMAALVIRKSRYADWDPGAVRSVLRHDEKLTFRGGFCRFFERRGKRRVGRERRSKLR